MFIKPDNKKSCIWNTSIPQYQIIILYIPFMESKLSSTLSVYVRTHTLCTFFLLTIVSLPLTSYTGWSSIRQCTFYSLLVHLLSDNLICVTIQVCYFAHYMVGEVRCTLYRLFDVRRLKQA